MWGRWRSNYTNRSPSFTRPSPDYSLHSKHLTLSALHCTALHCTLHCSALHTALHCTALTCTMHCTALHCTHDTSSHMYHGLIACLELPKLPPTSPGSHRLTVPLTHSHSLGLFFFISYIFLSSLSASLFLQQSTFGLLEPLTKWHDQYICLEKKPALHFISRCFCRQDVYHCIALQYNALH